MKGIAASDIWEEDEEDRPSPVVVPATFIGFCAWMGIRLTPGQTEFARVAFDGGDPEGSLGEQLFGKVGEIPTRARGVVAAICGGRAGKSYVIVALRMCWGMLTRNLSSLAFGQRAVALVVAPRDDLRQEVVNYALGAFRSKPELKAMLRLPRGTTDDDIVSEFTIKRPDGHSVRFQAGVSTAGGYGGRGKSLTDFCMDEAAFFRDKGHAVNDQDIYDAASARVLPGGQSIIASTPWGKAGLLYETYAKNYEKPKTALVAVAPTLLLHDSEMTQTIVARAYEVDRDNAEREFGAKFMSAGTEIFFDPSLIDSCIDPTLFPDVVRKRQPGEGVAAGGDLGFRSNSSCLVVTHRKGRDAIVAEIVEEVPEPGKPLKPKAVMAKFAARLLEHGSQEFMADGHYKETATEELEEHNLTFVDAPLTPADTFIKCRQFMRGGHVKMPNHERLVQQLKEVRGKPIPGGGMSIIMPRWAQGAHGDIAAAFVLSIFQFASEPLPAPPPDENSAEYQEAALERRVAAHNASKDTTWAGRAAADRGPNAKWKRHS